MTIDEQNVKLRDVIFARRTRKNGLDTAPDDGYQQLFQAVYIGLEKSEQLEMNRFLFHTVPDAEFEGAVEYLKRTVKPDNMREILEIMQIDKKAGVETELPFTAKMDIRTMLRHGGITWNSIYLDDNCEELLLEAARRFASEHPELGFDL